MNVLNNNLSNETNPCFHTLKNEKLKHECLKLLDGNATARTLINQLRKELSLLPILQHVRNNALISVSAIIQKSVTCNPSLNVAREIVHISIQTFQVMSLKELLANDFKILNRSKQGDHFFL
ncbi:hypothetical protein ACTFIR_003818 [Dictyostelium discoideum]